MVAKHWRRREEWATTLEAAKVWIWRISLERVKEPTKIPNREVRL